VFEHYEFSRVINAFEKEVRFFLGRNQFCLMVVNLSVSCFH
jgi:hypothetical protein